MNSRSTSHTNSKAFENKTTPGKIISERREAKDISQADLAQRLRLDTKVVKHLEFDDFEKLPGTTFIKGYLRSIAKELDLEPEVLLDSYHSVAKVAHEPSLSDFESRPPPQASSNSLIVKIGSYGIAVISLLLIIFWWQSNDKSINDTTERAPEEPLDSFAGTPLPYEFEQITHSDSPSFRIEDSEIEPANASVDETGGPTNVIGEELGGNNVNGVTELGNDQAGFNLRLTTTAESWVEIYDSGDKQLYFGMANSRAPVAISSAKPLRLLIGNTPSVELKINNQAIDLAPLSVDGVARFDYP